MLRAGCGEGLLGRAALCKDERQGTTRLEGVEGLLGQFRNLNPPPPRRWPEARNVF